MPAASFSVYQGPQPGTIIGKAARLATAKSYEVHVAEGDPAVEANWFFKAVCTDHSMMLMGGFNSGKQVALRARGVNNAGPGPWSPPVTFIPR